MRPTSGTSIESGLRTSLSAPFPSWSQPFSRGCTGQQHCDPWRRLAGHDDASRSRRPSAPVLPGLPRRAVWIVRRPRSRSDAEQETRRVPDERDGDLGHCRGMVRCVAAAWRAVASVGYPPGRAASPARDDRALVSAGAWGGRPLQVDVVLVTGGAGPTAVSSRRRRIGVTKRRTRGS